MTFLKKGVRKARQIWFSKRNYTDDWETKSCITTIHAITQILYGTTTTTTQPHGQHKQANRTIQTQSDKFFLFLLSLGPASEICFGLLLRRNWHTLPLLLLIDRRQRRLRRTTKTKSLLNHKQRSQNVRHKRTNWTVPIESDKLLSFLLSPRSCFGDLPQTSSSLTEELPHLAIADRSEPQKQRVRDRDACDRSQRVSQRRLPARTA
jgi:hypothetical protein